MIKKQKNVVFAKNKKIYLLYQIAHTIHTQAIYI